MTTLGQVSGADFADGGSINWGHKLNSLDNKGVLGRSLE